MGGWIYRYREMIEKRRDTDTVLSGNTVILTGLFFIETDIYLPEVITMHHFSLLFASDLIAHQLL